MIVRLFLSIAYIKDPDTVVLSTIRVPVTFVTSLKIVELVGNVYVRLLNSREEFALNFKEQNLLYFPATLILLTLRFALCRLCAMSVTIHSSFPLY
jgi:hypothetical protein